MPDKVLKAQYAYVIVPNRSGQGARVLGALRQSGVNLLAFTGFPGAKGQAQLVMVPERMAQLRKVARREGWKLSPVKRSFLISGKDRAGAVERHIQRLARAGIAVTAASATKSRGGSYGMILWVKPASFARAAKALGAR